MKYFCSILLFIIFSCNNKEEKFTQPKILEKNSEFDLVKLTFNEDIKTLISKSVDSTRSDFKGDNDSKKAKSSFYDKEKIMFLNKKRHHFETLEKDSISHFFGLHTSVIKFETDSIYSLKACWSSAKVFDKSKLDSALHEMYITYGKTNWMKNYQSELGLQEVVYAHTDEDGKVTHEIKHKEFDIDYEAYLYEYDISSSEYYQQWNLDDRIVQINISKGTESIIELTSGKYVRKPYYKVEFLSVLMSEFDLMKNLLIQESTKNNYPMRIVKSYYIRELDFYLNFNKYYISENADGVKIYDFNK